MHRGGYVPIITTRSGAKERRTENHASLVSNVPKCLKLAFFIPALASCGSQGSERQRCRWMCGLQRGACRQLVSELFHAVSFLLFYPLWGIADAEIKVPFVENPELTVTCSHFKRDVGQTIATHA